MSPKDMQDKLAEAARRAFGDPLDLLLEWFRWWAEDESVPVKLPDSLHTRTASLLSVSGRRDEVDAIIARDYLRDPSTCSTCGHELRPRVGAAGAYYELHTDSYHEFLQRQQAVEIQAYLYRLLARKAGHKITINFTAEWAWASCGGPCHWRSELYDRSNVARHAARSHEVQYGAKIMSWYRKFRVTPVGQQYLQSRQRDQEGERP